MFEFDTEQERDIRDSVSRLAHSEIPNYSNETHYGTVPRKLFQSFAELGLTGLSIPEGHGGIEARPTTIALVMEEIAKVNLGPAIFLSVHNMVSGLISKFGSDEQRERFLPKLASGEHLAAFALSEPSAGSDAAGLRTVARAQGNHFELQGDKCWITSGGFADLYLVFAKTDLNKGKKGISAFLVEKDFEGLSWGSPEKKMGCELSPISTLQFEKMMVPKTHLLGEVDNGYRIALGGLAGGRINIASCAVGLADGALTRALAYIQERKQFDRPLIEFQGLQFMVADMKMQLEAARMMTWRAAHQLGKDATSRSNRLFPSLAKCFATDAAMKIATDAVQLFGGAGYVKEYEIERYMRDAKMLQIVEGTNQVQRAVIAKEMTL